MRLRGILTVVACLLLAGVAPAQDKKVPPMTSPGDPRVTLPPGTAAPTNTVKGAANQRGYGDPDARVTYHNLTRLLAQPEKSGRTYLMEPSYFKDTHQATLEPLLRNRMLLHLQPGDKVNRVTESANGRSSAVPPTRSAPPSPRYAPPDRQGTSNP